MAILEVKDLKKSFGDAEVLKGISFSLEEKNVLAIIGSSGSGKTTLLRCINMLETADSGSITVDGGVVFDGSNTDKLSAQQQRENQLKIGLVFQSFSIRHSRMSLSPQKSMQRAARISRRTARLSLPR